MENVTESPEQTIRGYQVSIRDKSGMHSYKLDRGAKELANKLASIGNANYILDTQEKTETIFDNNYNASRGKLH
jgi:6-phosphogluconolactonase (cycloisomerase 2 family)